MAKGDFHDDLTSKLEQLVQEGLDKKTFPTLEAQVIHGGRSIAKFQTELKPSIYDVASLTKPLITTVLVFQLIEKRVLEFNQSIASVLDFLPDEYQAICIEDLLLHRSGLKAHLDWYKDILQIHGDDPMQLATVLRQEKERWYQSQFTAALIELDKVGEPIYSDLGFMLLGWAVEKLTGKKFEEVAHSQIFSPLGLSHSFFSLVGKAERMDEFQGMLIQPTEICPWRGEIKGLVHDDNAWTMGGVAGHAGWFSSMKDVLKLSQTVMDALRSNENILEISPNLWRQMTTPQVLGAKKIYRTLGWDCPARDGTSTAGDFWSEKAFGHLGFTGTSVWMDPVLDLLVVILSNRVYPSREDKGFSDFRRQFHQAIGQAVIA